MGSFDNIIQSVLQSTGPKSGKKAAPKDYDADDDAQGNDIPGYKGPIKDTDDAKQFSKASKNNGRNSPRMATAARKFGGKNSNQGRKGFQRGR